MVFRRKNQSGSPSLPDPPSAASSLLPGVSQQYTYDPGSVSFGSSAGLFRELPPAPAKPAVPHEQQAEPIRALKAAYLIAGPESVRFTSLNHYDAGSRVHYAPEAEATCHCHDDGSGTMGFSYAYLAAAMRGAHLPPGPHKRPGHDTRCGFYAWKHGEPFPFRIGTWLLEVDLYGRVIEHEHGYRAQKQRILRASPVPGLLCEPPWRLVAANETGQITLTCGSCPDIAGHQVTPDRLRALLNVEIDLGWAQSMRDGA